MVRSKGLELVTLDLVCSPGSPGLAGECMPSCQASLLNAEDIDSLLDREFHYHTSETLLISDQEPYLLQRYLVARKAHSLLQEPHSIGNLKIPYPAYPA